MAASSLCISLLSLLVVAPGVVECCSCAQPPSTIKRSVGIRDDFCFSDDVYSAVVLSATCNCVPGTTTTTGSSFVNCVNYDLQLGQEVNTSIISRGQCDFQRYYAVSCSAMRTSVVPPGATLVEEGEMDDLPITNLTEPEESCRLSCPFNAEENDYGLDDHFQYEHCIYTVKVRETFKGDYASDEVIRVRGPDTATSCGDPSRRLRLGTEYVAGIGGACSPITSWSELSDYSADEIEQLREEMDCGTATLFPSIVLSLLSLTVAMM